jgi:ABC-type glycerol-3-phosphate transport system substrate-binding protein
MRRAAVIALSAIALAACSSQAATTIHQPPVTAKPSVTTVTPAPPATTPATSPSVAAFGRDHGFKYRDGTTVSITSATLTALSQEAAGGNPGDPAVLFLVRVTAGSTSLDVSEIEVNANGGPDGTQLNQAYDTNIGNPAGILTPGETGTYQFEFDLQHSSWGSHLDVTITLNTNYNPASFTGSIS